MPWQSLTRLSGIAESERCGLVVYSPILSKEPEKGSFVFFLRLYASTFNSPVRGAWIGGTWAQIIGFGVSGFGALGLCL